MTNDSAERFYCKSIIFS